MYNLTLILLTWRIWWASNNASKWQMGFKSAFKLLMLNLVVYKFIDKLQKVKIWNCEQPKSTGSNRKRAMENLKSTITLNKRAWNTPQIKTTKMSHKLSQIRPDTLDNERGHKHLKFLTTFLSQYLTNLMNKICFTISFISCLYMLRTHVLIIRRSKLHYTAYGIL